MTEEKIINLEQAVEDLTHELREHESCQNNTKWLIRGIWALFVSLVGLIFTAVFFLGGLNERVAAHEARLNRNEIKKEVWDQYSKKIDDNYNMTFFNKDTRFSTRGQKLTIR